MVYLTSFKVMWRRVTQCYYRNVNYITFKWFNIGVVSKYTKKANVGLHNSLFQIRLAAILMNILTVS